MIQQRFTVRLPNGLQGTAVVRVDLEQLAQDLAWKAYYNKRRRAVLKNGAIVVHLIDDGSSRKEQP